MAIETVAMGYILYNSKILLVKHKKSGRFMSCGGHVEKNELVQEAVIREIKEELNLDVRLISAKRGNVLPAELPYPFIISCKDLPNGNKLQIFEFICETDSLDALKLLNSEITDWRLFGFEEIKSSENLTPVVKEILLNLFNQLNMYS